VRKDKRQEKEQQKKMSWTWVFVAAFMVALILLNLQLFFGIQIFPVGPSKLVCYKDACIVGEADPITEIRGLIDGSEHLILVAEADPEGKKTQTSAYIGAALSQMAVRFWQMNTSVYGIEVEDGHPIGCLNHSLEECLSLEPGAGEFMIWIKYPSSLERNQIRIDGRTLTFQAKSGLETFALTDMFKRIFP
jgi:hypothetical protein